ncbi:MAG: DUF3029 family protein, partial [Chromatiaceae bacterium]
MLGLKPHKENRRRALYGLPERLFWRYLDRTLPDAFMHANIGPTDAGQKNCGTGLAAPGESRTYNLYTPHEGAFIINSYGA